MQTCKLILAALITMHAWVHPGLYQTGWRRVVRDWAPEVVLARIVHIAIALSQRKRKT